MAWIFFASRRSATLTETECQKSLMDGANQSFGFDGHLDILVPKQTCMIRDHLIPSTHLGFAADEIKIHLTPVFILIIHCTH